VNVKEELDIKNRFTVFEDKIVVALPNSAFTCDLDDIDVVEDYLWYLNKNGMSWLGSMEKHKCSIISSQIMMIPSMLILNLLMVIL